MENNNQNQPKKGNTGNTLLNIGITLGIIAVGAIGFNAARQASTASKQPAGPAKVEAWQNNQYNIIAKVYETEDGSRYIGIDNENGPVLLEVVPALNENGERRLVQNGEGAFSSLSNYLGQVNYGGQEILRDTLIRAGYDGRISVGDNMVDLKEVDMQSDLAKQVTAEANVLKALGTQDRTYSSIVDITTRYSN